LAVSRSRRSDIETGDEEMKALLITAIVTAALVVAAPALSGSWHTVRDGNAWVYSSQSSPQTLASSAHVYGAYVYGGASPAVARSIQEQARRSGGYPFPKSTPKPAGVTFITDTLGGTGGPVTHTVYVNGGFKWSDAGIGAATAFGALVMLLAASTLAMRRRRTLAI
jgi:hypothetical protein